MRCNNVLGLIFAGTLDEKMPDLTSSRTMASVPIGGKYRIIDFVLSNMSNSGINNVGVVATKNYLSLADHLGSGSAYDLSKRRSQLTLLTPYNGSSFSSYPETIYNMHGYIETAVRNMYCSHRAILFLILTAQTFLIFTPKRMQTLP